MFIPDFTKNNFKEIACLFSSIECGKMIGYLKFLDTGKRDKKSSYAFIKAGKCDDSEILEEALMAKPLRRANSMVSLASYKTFKHADINNILNVWGLAVDVDYHLHKDQEIIEYKEAMYALEQACLNGFPRPTLVEHSRNMRLIYVLNDPYRIPQNKRKGGTLTFLKRIVKVLAEKLNSHTDYLYFNASPQPLTSFMRLPGSINYRADWQKDDEGKWRPGFKEGAWCVEVENFSWKWDIDKLAEEVLPEKFAGYEEWKKKSKSRKKKNITPKSSESLAHFRLMQLEELQRRGYSVGYRNNLCFFYQINLAQAGYTDEEARQRLQKFNEGFGPFELTPTELKYTKPVDYCTGGIKYAGWMRRFRDLTIREKLGLGNAEPDLFTGKGSLLSKRKQQKKYRDKKYRKEHAGFSKKELMSYKAGLAVYLKWITNKTWLKIARKFGVCEKTIRNYSNLAMRLIDEDPLFISKTVNKYLELLKTTVSNKIKANIKEDMDLLKLNQEIPASKTRKALVNLVYEKTAKNQLVPLIIAA